MDYLEYGPYSFMYWDDINRAFAWQNRSSLDIELERRSIEYSKSKFYQELKQRRALTNG